MVNFRLFTRNLILCLPFFYTKVKANPPEEDFSTNLPENVPLQLKNFTEKVEFTENTKIDVANQGVIYVVFDRNAGPRIVYFSKSQHEVDGSVKQNAVGISPVTNTPRGTKVYYYRSSDMAPQEGLPKSVSILVWSEAPEGATKGLVVGAGGIIVPIEQTLSGIGMRCRCKTLTNMCEWAVSGPSPYKCQNCQGVDPRENISGGLRTPGATGFRSPNDGRIDRQQSKNR